MLVVDPAGILAESPRGTNDLYVALTRSTRRLGDPAGRAAAGDAVHCGRVAGRGELVPCVGSPCTGTKLPTQGTRSPGWPCGWRVTVRSGRSCWTGRRCATRSTGRPRTRWSRRSTRSTPITGVRAAVLWGAGGTFCAGADLGAIAGGQANRLEPDGDGPMGPTRMRTRVPVIAAVERVRGGRRAGARAVVRPAGGRAGRHVRRVLPALGRAAHRRRHRTAAAAGRAGPGARHDPHRPAGGRGRGAVLGLADRVVPAGTARPAAEALAAELAALPPVCLRNDRASVYDGAGLPPAEAMAVEFEYGLRTLASGEAAAGATRFTSGAGRHGEQSR